MTRWILCYILGRHDYLYKYRDVGGIRTWADGSFSTGPEHIGWVCRRCGHYRGTDYYRGTT